MRRKITLLSALRPNACAPNSLGAFVETARRTMDRAGGRASRSAAGRGPDDARGGTGTCAH